MKNNAVYEYFYYFLKLILLFDGSEAMTETRKRKENYLEKMREICKSNNLNAYDIRFLDLIDKLDLLVKSDKPLDNLDFDYLLFINPIHIRGEGEPIYEYFFYFLKFYLLFGNPDHIRKEYDRKKEYDNIMTEIAVENKLKEIDQRFIEMIWDMDYEITTNHGVYLIIQNYKDFILTYGEDGYLPKTVSSWK